ncbi:hypothetical protein Btru_041131 [Bulinus truncatus]|nr:hypothetical protein Btru_041131 [Bulinus truncatus]
MDGKKEMGVEMGGSEYDESDGTKGWGFTVAGANGFFVLEDIDKNCSQLDIRESCNSTINSHVNIRLIDDTLTVVVDCYQNKAAEETICARKNKANYLQDCLSTVVKNNSWPASVGVYSCSDGSLRKQSNNACVKDLIIAPVVLPMVIVIQTMLIVALVCRNRTGRRARLSVLQKTKIMRESILPRKALQSCIFPKRKTLITFLRKNDPPPDLEFLKYTQTGSQQNSFRREFVNGVESVPAEDACRQETVVMVTVAHPTQADPNVKEVLLTSYEEHDERDEPILQESEDRMSRELIKPEMKLLPVVVSDGSSIYSTIPMLKKTNLIHSANKHYKYIPHEAQEERKSNVYIDITGRSDHVAKTITPSPNGRLPVGSSPASPSKSAFRKLNVQCWSNPCVPAPGLLLDLENRRSKVSDSHIYSEIAWLDNLMLVSKTLEDESTIEEGIRTCNNERYDSECNVVPTGSSKYLPGLDRTDNDLQKSDYDWLGNNSATEHLYAPFRQSSCSSQSLNVSQNSHTYMEADVCIAEFYKDKSDEDEISATGAQHGSVRQILTGRVDSLQDSKEDDAETPGTGTLFTQIEADDDDDDDTGDYLHPEGYIDDVSSTGDYEDDRHCHVDENCRNLETKKSEELRLSVNAVGDEREDYADLMDSLYIASSDYRDQNTLNDAS